MANDNAQSQVCNSLQQSTPLDDLGMGLYLAEQVSGGLTGVHKPGYLLCIKVEDLKSIQGSCTG